MSATIITGYYTSTYTLTAANSPLTNQGTIYMKGNGEPISPARRYVTASAQLLLRSSTAVKGMLAHGIFL